MPMDQEGTDVCKAEDVRLLPTEGREEAAPVRRRPTTCCLINNYNYGRYVREAVDSALAQTLSFDEIVVVDDGSTDGSQELLLGVYGDDPRVRIVLKPNGGQLSAFQAGLVHSKSDVVFFLDADDRFLPSRLERTLEVFCLHPACEAVFVPVLLFGGRSGIGHMRDAVGQCVNCFDTPEPYSLFGGSGFTVELSEYCRNLSETDWVGSPTSGLAVKRRILQTFLPLPPELEQDWRVRADDCVVHGLSLANACRIYLHSPLVEYRVHGGNLFFGRPEEDPQSRRRKLDSLFEALREKLGLPNGAHRAFLASVEILVSGLPNRMRALERAWRLPRKAGLTGQEKWLLRKRLVLHLFGKRTGDQMLA